MGLLCQIESDPTVNMSKLAKELDVSERTIRRAVIQLGMHS